MFGSDIHLSHRPPVARSSEEDWYEAMAKPLRQVKEFCDDRTVPFVIAGDLFDKWNPPPQLIEFAITHLPEVVVAIPGQHDLPNHNYSLMSRSGYGVLKAAKRIHDVPYGGPYRPPNTNGELAIWAFPWGFPIEPPESKYPGMNVCLAHQYIWVSGHAYHGAPMPSHLKEAKVLRHFELAVFGDNHKGFLAHKKNTTIFNCGGFMRRTSDQEQYQPCVGLLYKDGSLVRWPLNTDDETFIRNPNLDKVVPEMDMDEFIAEMRSLGDIAVSFPDQLLRYIDTHDLPTGVESALRSLIVPF